MTALSRILQLQATTQGWAPAAPDTIRRVVIVGGGSAGWMAAAALSNVLGKHCQIILVESELIGTVGVGEATIPTIRLLNQTMGVDEKTFLKETQGTFKLGIEFVNWGREDHRYFHPFGSLGLPMDEVPVYQHWLHQRQADGVGSLDEYTLAWQAARQGRFGFPTQDPQLLSSTFNYAFHFDASLYAQYLKKLSVGRGVQRIEGQITRVDRHAQTGFVTQLVLKNGQTVGGDLFIDCSGFRSLLLGESLGVGYESWAHWLPCDRAVAMPCELNGPPLPFTRATALKAGWQWTIPLRHRVGNGHVFSSSFISEDEATLALQSRLPGAAQGSPRVLQFTPGRRHKAWEKNVVALGLASGFLEPLESTSLHLVHSGITTLLSLFPTRLCDGVIREEYNRRVATEMERIRDFVILHYKLNAGKEGEMWRHCTHMTVPDSLQERMELFRHGAYVQVDNHDLFGPESWVMLQVGQGHLPAQQSPLLNLRRAQSRQQMIQLRQALARTANTMPSHESILKNFLQ